MNKKKVVKKVKKKSVNGLSDIKFRKFVENSSDIIYTLSEDGKFTYVSPNWTNLLGHDVSEVEGKLFTKFVLEQDIETFFKFLKKILDGEEISKGIEYRVLHKDGTLRWHSSTGSVLDKNKDGKLKFLGVARDITHRKETEKRLQDSEKKYKLIFEQAPVGIFHFNEKAEITDCNDNFVKIIGSSYKALIGMKMLGLPDKMIVNALKSTLKGNLSTYEGIYSSVTADKITPVRIIFTPTLSNSKQVKGGIGIVEDIGDRVEAEKSLRESEEKFRKYTQQAPLGIFITNSDGEFLEVNKTACEMTGYSEKELIGLSVEDFLVPEFSDEVLGIFSKVQEEGFTEGDVMVMNKKKQKFWINLTAIELDKNKYLAFCKEITERKEAEDKLQYHFKFEKVVSDVASYFVGLPSEKVDEGINYALKMLGGFFEVDRSYIFRFSEGEKYMSNTHEWCAEGVEPQIASLQKVKSSSMSWWIGKVKKDGYINIYDVDKLPSVASSEKEILKAQGVKSLLCISMLKDLHIQGGYLYGFFGFDSVNTKTRWTKEHITLLKVVVELISNALSRHFAEEQIRRLTFHDSLTGLHNRLYLETKMKRLDTKRNYPISVIMVDLNGLKLVNDTYGHFAGDKMLRQAGVILKGCCRGEDVVTRWGGDEFVIFLPKTSEFEAERISQRIQNTCSKTFIEDVPMSMALGVAVKKDANKTLSALLTEAENYMYKNKLTERRSDKSKLLDAILKTLAEKSHETEGHTRRMGLFGLKMGEALGLPDSELSRLKLLISLHDIGKINISEDILTKDSSLDKDEWEIIKQHPETGYRIARATEEFAYVAEDILSHHERWDGLGYPHGLKGEEISLLARIVSIVDAYEVMSYGRPYKKGMAREEIIEEFKKSSGKQFDPNLVTIFLDLFKDV